MATWTAPRDWTTGETVTAALLNTHVRDNLKTIGGTWSTYTPTITGTGWAIGNGTVAGVYFATSGLTIVNIRAVWGNTSTFGAGALTFSLPNTPVSGKNWIGSCILSDTGTATYHGYSYATGGSATVKPQAVNASATYATGSDVSTNVPHTWANTDQVDLTIVYTIA